MSRTGDLWDPHVSGAKAGSTYSFEIESPAGKASRIDPYCRELTPDRQRCRVIDPTSFAWGAVT